MRKRGWPRDRRTGVKPPGRNSVDDRDLATAGRIPGCPTDGACERKQQREHHSHKSDASRDLNVDTCHLKSPVVLLHGFPDSGRLWRNQVPALVEAGFKVIVPDMRGYGRSDKPAEASAYTMDLLVGDVLATIMAFSHRCSRAGGMPVCGMVADESLPGD